MYLIRNFASLTKMKSHDMNRDGKLFIMVSSVSRMKTWFHDSRITCSDWNLKLHDMWIGLVDEKLECRRTKMEMNEANAIGQKSWDGFANNNYYFCNMKCKDVGWHWWNGGGRTAGRKEFITCMNHDSWFPDRIVFWWKAYWEIGLVGKLGLLAYWEIGLAGEPDWDIAHLRWILVNAISGVILKKK